MTVTTLTATVSRFTRQHTHPVAFQPEQLLCAEIKPTVSVSTEAAPAPIMVALLSGSDRIAFLWAVGVLFCHARSAFITANPEAHCVIYHQVMRAFSEHLQR
jgi:hypothetical protein